MYIHIYIYIYVYVVNECVVRIYMLIAKCVPTVRCGENLFSGR